MTAILRGVALGLLVLAITLHVVGFVTNSWFSANLDKRDIEKIMSASGMKNLAMLPNGMEMSVKMGLWQFCLHVNLGVTVPGMASVTDMCKKPDVKDVPDWMKAVQALGILSMIAGALGVVFLVYGFLGGSKGDRAKLMPYIQAASCLMAGVLLLLGVVVYGAEYGKMKDQMRDQMSMMGKADPSMGAMFQNMMDNIGLGYSFALEAVAGVMMVLVAFVIVIPAVRGFIGGSPHNLAV